MPSSRSTTLSCMAGRLCVPLLALVMFAGIAVSHTYAQTFPVKPVKLVVPFAPGGGNDTFARLLGQKLGDVWNQSVIIDNRAGAGGNIGTEFVTKAAPDVGAGPLL